jgi:serine/threonine protein kinase
VIDYGSLEYLFCYTFYKSILYIMKNAKGGKVLASGGFGCVFSPALKCQGETKQAKGIISKLMTEKHAIEEYEEIVLIKTKLDKIKNYEDYFLINDATLCKPAPLTTSDLTDFSSKCSALPKDKITKSNINSNLDKLMSLNIPNGGLPVDDYIYDNGSLEKLYEIHNSLVKLLKKGVVPMNNKNIYHCDIKDSNVLLDDTSSDLKARLIDWGLTTEYVPFENNPFPKTWRNRPFQFNVPFSVIIFSDDFIHKYTNYLKDGGVPEETQLKPFVIDYINFWIKERGPGHYKFINEIMFNLFSNSLTSISDESKPQVIETQITMDYIINYIIDVLVHFTRFRDNGTLNLREYLDKVFIKIVDIWGFISVYYPMIQLLSSNYSKLSNQELEIFNQLKFIFVEYLYNPRHEPIDMNMLYSDFKDLGNLFRIKLMGKNKSFSLSRTLPNKTTSSSKKHSKSSRINKQTRKNRTAITNISFKRKPPQKRFRNPVFLSLK